VSGTAPWGWYTTSNPDCSHGEIHDVSGDSTVPSRTEAHCIPNGTYLLRFERVTWSADGSSYTSQLLFTRNIAMLNAIGAPNDSIGGSQLVNYHDQHVRFDLNAATTTLSGSIQAGEEIHEMQTTNDLYGAQSSFTIAAGDTLWLISTYTASGDDSRPWYNSVTGVMTKFNADYARDPDAFGGSVNSVPNWNAPSKPFLTSYSSQDTATFLVRGLVSQPYESGSGSAPGMLTSAITVHVVPPVSCFVHSDTLAAHASIHFNGSCSSAYPGGMYDKSLNWDWGDGTSSGWQGGIDTASHTYSAAGNYTVRLDVRRVFSTAPVVSSSQPLQVSAVVAGITGPDIIWSTGSYTWYSSVSGGQSPFHYKWYYKKGGTESLVDSVNASYTRTVSTAGAPYVFRIRLVVTDAQPDTANVIYWVDVPGSGGGAAPTALLGTRDPNGGCRVLPASRAGRRTRYDAIVAAGGWPELCYAQGSN